MEETIKRLDTLLKEGRTEEILKIGIPIGFQEATLEQRAEVNALLGMAYYRRKEFFEARSYFQAALMYYPENERALYGMAYLAAYADKDSDRVHEWIYKLPEGAARDNALVIIARSDEYLHDTGIFNAECEVEDILEERLVPNPSDYLNTANVLHNAARFYMKITEDETTPGKSEKEDLCKALAYLQMAIGLYGTGNMNLHHRAATNYWISVAMEKLLGPAAAVPPACESLKLWYEQLQLDPRNPHYGKSYIDTEQHFLRLLTKVSTLSQTNPENMYLKNLFNEAPKALDNEKSHEERDIISL